MEKNRTEASSLLQHEAELEEIVRLVGADALSDSDRLTLQTAKMIREDFLHQNAFMDVDTYTSLEKQFKMLNAILHYHHKCREALDAGIEMEKLGELPVLERIARADRQTLAARARALEQSGAEVEPGDLEAALDALRLLRREETSLAACLDLGGAVPFEEISEFLSILAETITRRALWLARDAVCPTASERILSVIGMGKIAGREFTYQELGTTRERLEAAAREVQEKQEDQDTG